MIFQLYIYYHICKKNYTRKRVDKRNGIGSKVKEEEDASVGMVI